MKMYRSSLIKVNSRREGFSNSKSGPSYGPAIATKATRRRYKLMEGGNFLSQLFAIFERSIASITARADDILFETARGTVFSYLTPRMSLN
jgi:hypothetical protein